MRVGWRDEGRVGLGVGSVLGLRGESLAWVAGLFLLSVF